MNKYICYYKNERLEVYASSVADAVLAVASKLHIRTRDRGEIRVLAREVSR